MLFLSPPPARCGIASSGLGWIPHSLRAQPGLTNKHYYYFKRTSHDCQSGDPARLVALSESLWKTRCFCLHRATGWTTSRERKATLVLTAPPRQTCSRGTELPTAPRKCETTWDVSVPVHPTLLHCKSHPPPRCCRVDPAWITATTGTKHCHTQQTLPRPLLWWAQGGLGCFIPQSVRTGPL